MGALWGMGQVGLQQCCLLFEEGSWTCREVAALGVCFARGSEAPCVCAEVGYGNVNYS